MIKGVRRFLVAVLSVGLGFGLCQGLADEPERRTVAAGEAHAVIVTGDGEVWAWGWNERGQVGNGTVGGVATPTRVMGLERAVSVAAGGDHTLALLRDGTVWAWGRNDTGQLGDGTWDDRPTPVRVAGLERANAIAAGQHHSLAILDDGSLWAWGANGSGQLGDGSYQDRATPVMVSRLAGVVMVAAGARHSLAVTRALATDGSTFDRGWSWGSNRNDQLGDGTSGRRIDARRVERQASSPYPVEWLRSFTAIASLAAGNVNSLAVGASGEVLAWGEHQYGVAWHTMDATSSPVGQLSTVKRVAAGANHALALRDDGSVVVWGYNPGYGVFGSGSRARSSSAAPLLVPGLLDVVEIAAGGYFSLAVRRDGTVVSWGRNDKGQLADGTRDDGLVVTPVCVSGSGASCRTLELNKLDFDVTGGGLDVSSLVTWSDLGIGVAAQDAVSEVGVGWSAVPTSDPLGWVLEVVISGRVPTVSGGATVTAFPFGVVSLAVPSGEVWVDDAGLELQVWDSRRGEWLTLTDAFAGERAVDEVAASLWALGTKLGVDVVSAVVPSAAVVPYLMIVPRVLAEWFDGNVDASSLEPTGAAFRDADGYRLVQRPWRLAAEDLEAWRLLRDHGGMLSLRLRIPVYGVPAGRLGALASHVSFTTEHSWFFPSGPRPPLTGTAAAPIFPESAMVPRREGWNSRSAYVVRSLAGEGFTARTDDFEPASAWMLGARAALGMLPEPSSRGVREVSTARRLEGPGLEFETRFTVEAEHIGVDSWWVDVIVEGEAAAPQALWTQVFREGVAYLAIPNVVGLKVGEVELQLFNHATGEWDPVVDEVARASVAPLRAKHALAGQAAADAAKLIANETGRALLRTVSYLWSVTRLLDAVSATNGTMASVSAPAGVEFEDANRYRLVERSWRFDGTALGDWHRYWNPREAGKGSMRLRVRFPVSGLTTEALRLSRAHVALVDEVRRWEVTAAEDFARGGFVVAGREAFPRVVSASRLALAIADQPDDPAVAPLAQTDVQKAQTLRPSSAAPPPVTVSAGMEHYLAVDRDGFVWAWGGNRFRQLGNPLATTSVVPVPVCRSYDAEECFQLNVGAEGQVSAGMDHSLAVDSDGYVWGWGSNRLGQLGTGAGGQSDLAVRVCSQGSEGSCDHLNVKGGMVSAGSGFSLAIDSEGLVWAWGLEGVDERVGVLGTGVTGGSRSPLAVCRSGSGPTCDQLDLGNTGYVSAGGLASLALDSLGGVWTWGTTFTGFDGPTHPPERPHTKLLNAVRVCAQGTGPGCDHFSLEGGRVAAGGHVFVAVDDDGLVYSWGENARGALGDPLRQPLDNPAPVCARGGGDTCEPFVLGPTGIISVGNDFAIAADGRGGLWAWGNNDNSQLGDNSSASRPNPVAVCSAGRGECTQFVIGPNGVVAAAWQASIAVDSNGAVWAWGGRPQAICAFGRGADCPQFNIGSFPNQPGGPLGPSDATQPVVEDEATSVHGKAALDTLEERGAGSVTGDTNPTPAEWSRLSVGMRHVLITDRDGFVWTWSLDRPQPKLVCMAEGIGACVPLQLGEHGRLSAGGHSLAVDPFGRVYQWTHNSAPELVCAEGNNRLRQEACVTLEIGLHGSISAGRDHSLAVDEDGWVWAWGQNDHGQLGNGATRSSAVTVPVCTQAAGDCKQLNVGRTGQVSAGTAHSLARDAAGNVWAWGYNSGLLGDGTMEHRSVAVPVCRTGSGEGCPQFNVGAEGTIAAGGASLARDATGALWSWGIEDTRAAVDAPALLRPRPVCATVGGDDCPPFVVGPMSAIAGGWGFSVAIDGAGEAWMWGNASWLHHGAAHDPEFPSKICVEGAGPDCRALALGAGGVVDAAGGFAVAVTEEGQVFTWGLVNGGGSTSSLGRLLAAPPCAASGCVPLNVRDLSRPVHATPEATVSAPTWSPHVAAGLGHSLVLDTARRVWAWGDNGGGQVDARLPPGHVDQPHLIALPQPASMLGAGAQHSVALLDDATVWVWGLNTHGQSGSGSLLQTPHSGFGGRVAGVIGARTVVSGADHLLALRDDGAVWAWGRNDRGQLGNNSTADRPWAETVVRIDDVIQIAAGDHHSLALRRDGTVWSWGANTQGQLGIGGFSDALVPMPVPGLTNVTAIAAGGRISLALRSDGTLWIWGRYGGLAHQQRHLLVQDSDLPIQVDAVSDPVLMATGSLNSLAVLADGRTVSWGVQGYFGDDQQRLMNPVFGGRGAIVLLELMNARSLAIGRAHSLAMLEDGSVWSWGDPGPLGHRDATRRPAPVEGALLPP